MTEIVSVFMLGKGITGELGEGLQFLKPSVVEYRLNIMCFLGSWPKTISYGDKFILVLSCELNAKGNDFTFCDHVAYCESKTVQRNVFSWRLLYSTSPLDHGAYGVRGLNCTLYVRQKCVNSRLMYSFPLSVTKKSGIPNLTIQWSNNTVSAFVGSRLEKGEGQHSVWRRLR